MTAGRLWVRRITAGPWHLVPNEAGNLAACGTRVPWRWNTRNADTERYQGIPSGFGSGTVCPACARLVDGTPTRTVKQRLAAHIAEHHQGLPAGANRWTFTRLGRWHANQHHLLGGLDHDHAGPNQGPGDRPPGWYTGTDPIPRKN